MARASKDYIDIRQLLNTGYKVEAIKINLGSNNGRASIDFKNGAEDLKNITSEEDDVVMFAFTWKRLVDKNGDVRFGFVKDTGEFYDNIDYLTDRDGAKLRAAGEILRKGEVEIDFVPHDLIEEFLVDAGSNVRKYLPLRDKYFEIVWLHTAQVKDIYDGEQALRNKGQKTLDRLMLIYSLTSKAFRQEPNFLKNYQTIQSYCISDIYDILSKASDQISHSQHQMNMLVKEGGMQAKIGLRYPIEDYAGKGEILIKLMNILRAAIEITDGNASPKPKKKSSENWQIILNSPKYKDIIGNFDPRIRHGKAHQSYEIDEASKTIKFFQEGRIRKMVVEYSYDEFQQMWQDLQFILQTVMIALCTEHSAIAAYMLRSGEYKSLLVGLGNFRPD